jgi:hypothetical protein
MAITNYVLGTSPANIYISSGNTVVSTMYFCNNNTSAINLNVFLLPNAATVGNLNYQIYKDVQLASGDTYVVDMEKLVLANGEKIQANASTGSAVTATISYVGI